jgi:hypothetical protein
MRAIPTAKIRVSLVPSLLRRVPRNVSVVFVAIGVTLGVALGVALSILPVHSRIVCSFMINSFVLCLFQTDVSYISLEINNECQNNVRIPERARFFKSLIKFYMFLLLSYEIALFSFISFCA